jgi:hypothetical protein|tara:strand:- start:366 stop:728 length:363 start_codon:yes stop_codon:yes gene_type:complete
MDKTVFEGTDDDFSLIIVDVTNISEGFPKGTPIDFITNGVEAMELSLDNQVFKSADGLVSFADGGVITIKIGKQEGISKNIVHSASLRVIDPLHPDGQVLIHPKLKYSNLRIEVVSVNPS